MIIPYGIHKLCLTYPFLIFIFIRHRCWLSHYIISKSKISQFFVKSNNPFAKMKPGESLQAWSKQQSREPLPLNQEIPLVISAGPLDPGKPMKNLLEEYRTAPGFISLSATFSKTPPPAPVALPATAPKPTTAK